MKFIFLTTIVSCWRDSIPQFDELLNMMLSAPGKWYMKQKCRYLSPQDKYSVGMRSQQVTSQRKLFHLHLSWWFIIKLLFYPQNSPVPVYTWQLFNISILHFTLIAIIYPFLGLKLIHARNRTSWDDRLWSIVDIAKTWNNVETSAK